MKPQEPGSCGWHITRRKWNEMISCLCFYVSDCRDLNTYLCLMITEISSSTHRSVLLPLWSTSFFGSESCMRKSVLCSKIKSLAVGTTSPQPPIQWVPGFFPTAQTNHLHLVQWSLTLQGDSVSRHPKKKHKSVNNWQPPTKTKV